MVREELQVDVVVDVVAIDVELRAERVARPQHIVVAQVDAELLVLADLGLQSRIGQEGELRRAGWIPAIKRFGEGRRAIALGVDDVGREAAESP